MGDRKTSFAHSTVPDVSNSITACDRHSAAQAASVRAVLRGVMVSENSLVSGRYTQIVKIFGVERLGSTWHSGRKGGEEMFGWLTRPWFEARSLGVLQTYYDQPLKNPLPPFEARLLRGAVNLTRKDGGTPFDAATRFYAGYAETAVGQGRSLDDIGFAGVLGRMWALRDKMKFYDEHVAALKTVSTAAQTRDAAESGA